ASVDALERVDDVVRAHDPVLEQVSDALAALEEVDRGLDLDMRREEEDPDLRELSANRASGVEAFPRVCRRHADVEHDELGGLAAHDLVERGRVAGLSDHLVPRPAQQADDALANENVVVRDGDMAPGHASRAYARRQRSTAAAPGGKGALDDRRRGTPWR